MYASRPLHPAPYAGHTLHRVRRSIIIPVAERRFPTVEGRNVHVSQVTVSLLVSGNFRVNSDGIDYLQLY